MDLQSDIQRTEANGAGRFDLHLPGGKHAYLTYARVSDRQIEIDYSFVPPEFRGKGVAEMLVLRAVQDAREAQEKITPLCGFVASTFRRHPDWADVLA
jgi:predicted GNAT family acetyltransferase